MGFSSKSLPYPENVDYVELPTISPFGKSFGLYQVGLIKFFSQSFPDAVITFANLRYLSFWTTLIWCKLHNIPLYLHGHGLYRKRTTSLFWNFVYHVIFKFVTAYICYSQSVAESLVKIGLPVEKIKVAANSLVNPFPIRPDQKSGKERGILYIGRLRSGCGVELLIRAVAQLKDLSESKFSVHIIGDGPEAGSFRKWL